MAAEIDPALAAQIAAAVAAAVAAQPKPVTDWAGITAVLGGVLGILTLLLNTWASWSAKRDAARAARLGVETKQQLVEQTKNLDGKLKDLTDSLVDAAEKKGTLIEKEAQAGREAAVDKAALKAAAVPAALVANAGPIAVEIQQGAGVDGPLIVKTDEEPKP